MEHRVEMTAAPNSQYNSNLQLRPYLPVPRHLAAMFPDIERRHFNKIREFYYQQSERLSAFQYVRQQTMEKTDKRYLFLQLYLFFELLLLNAFPATNIINQTISYEIKFIFIVLYTQIAVCSLVSACIDCF